jgi:hypothetical protein
VGIALAIAPSLYADQQLDGALIVAAVKIALACSGLSIFSRSLVSSPPSLRERYSLAMAKQPSFGHCDGSVGPVRALGASAGIQFEGLLAEVYRVGGKVGSEPQKGFGEAIRRMARGGALLDSEERALLELGKRGFAVDDSRRDSHESE